jgi:hypothetical protein
MSTKNESKSLDVNEMNKAPKREFAEPKVSQNQISECDNYFKPVRWIADNQKFNTRFEKEWEFAKEYVQCIPVNNELKGEMIEFWTHPFGGKGAEFWRLPSNKPVWIPRYAAEQLTKCKYHRLVMDRSKFTNSDNSGQYFGEMVVETTVNRLDALPVSDKKSIFMGAAA